MFAKRFEDLPICQKIGDIIRVHRCNVSMFKETKQFNANIFFNASWALFRAHVAEDASDPDFDPSESEDEAGVLRRKQIAEYPRENRPFAFYGKTFTFEKHEQKNIKTLRTWVHKSFDKYPMLNQ